MKKGILIDVVKREVRHVEIDDTLQSIYDTIGCDTFDCVQIHDENDVYVDDNGLLNLTPHSKFFHYKTYPQPLCGNGLILGINHDNGESIDTTLTIEEVKRDVRFMDIYEVQLLSKMGMF
jgi:hypothetical protein